MEKKRNHAEGLGLVNQMIMLDGFNVGTDRLGSVRSTAAGAALFFPYGEERTATPNGQEKFGTYFRDADGNDYAIKRYYSSASGRYATPERYTFNPADPGGWNGFSYVKDGPVNFNNPNGGEESAPSPCYDYPLSDPECSGYAGPPGVYSDDDDQSVGGGATETNRDLLTSIKSTLDNALSHSDCAGLFGSPGFFSKLGGFSNTAQGVLDSLISGSAQYGSIKFVDPTDASLPFSVRNGLTGAAAVTVSNNPKTTALTPFASTSTIYISDFDLPTSFNSSLGEAELVVLHELGHLLYNLGFSSSITPDGLGGQCQPS